MNEDERLRQSLAQIQSKRRAENIEKLEESLPKAMKIIEMDIDIDNSKDGAELIKKGTRRNIYRKDGLYFLGDATGIMDDNLYAVTKDKQEIDLQFNEANSD